MKSIFLSVAGTALFGISVIAQTVAAVPATPVGPPPPGGPADTVFFYAPMGRVETLRRDMKPVLNAPYQADIVNESIQHLADGNVIQNSHSSKIARDSQGRTRTEETIDKIGPWSSNSGQRTIIFISDPVAKVSYVLHPEDKTAEKMPEHGFVRSFHAGGGNKSLTIRTDGGPEKTIAIRDADAAGVAGEAPNDRKVEDLGTQEINGVTATGKRVTVTIPANTIGNQLPIVSTNETWYSPELKTIVQSKRDDPRFGENTFSLTNIQKGEPPADLFQVPSDYTITSGPPKPPMPLKQ
jgi:hypothetical protein